jgi:hypothetical protein
VRTLVSAKRTNETGPVAETQSQSAPIWVANSPRQLQQARQIATVQASADSVPVQLTKGKGGKGQQPADDKNWWQRAKGWWQESMPYVLGGTSPHDNRGYLARVLPTMLGGQPVPQAPAPNLPKEKPKELTRKQLLKEEEKRQREARKETRRLEQSTQKADLPTLDESELQAPTLDLMPESKPSKQSLRRAKKREQKEEEARLEQERLEQQRQERLKATRSLPRRVVRYDRNFASVNNNNNQRKSHRVGSDLLPAGDDKVSAVEQLHQDSPNKGSSNRTSYASKKAANANDYSSGGTRPWVEFKARKHARAVIKGKQDALGFQSRSAQQVKTEVLGDNSTYATTSVPGNDGKNRPRKTSALNFAKRDGESQTIGRIPARFLRWSDQVGADPADSDSDDEATDSE